MICMSGGEVVHCYPVKSILVNMSPADQSSHMSFRWQYFLHALPSTTVHQRSHPNLIPWDKAKAKFPPCVQEATLTLLLKTSYFSLKPQCFFYKLRSLTDLDCSILPIISNETTVFYVEATQHRLDSSRFPPWFNYSACLVTCCVLPSTYVYTSLLANWYLLSPYLLV